MQAKTKLISKTKGVLYLFIMILSVSVLLTAPGVPSAASMSDYCLIPPYVKRDVKPNVLVMMDNSEEMAGAAYCTKDPGDPTICTDNYDSTKSYDGYYEMPKAENGYNNQYYCYTGSVWKPMLYSTAKCGGASSTPAIYSGNLLNWAAMSKFDLLQRILVGGISTSRQTNVNTLVGKSTNWTKIFTYRDSLGAMRSCTVVVTAGNVEFRDSTANSCGYLDSTPHPIVAFAGADVKYVAKSQSMQQPSPKGFLQRAFGFIAAALDLLVPSAEAAKPLSIGPGSPNNATECVAYPQFAVPASGGTTPYLFTVSAGALPPGLSLSAAAGTISGSPTASGNYNFTIRVTDNAGGSDSKAYSISIADNTVSISTTSPLQEGYVGSFYQVHIQAAGSCNASFDWELDPSSPALPAGFTFSDSGNDGVLLNPNPTVQGTFTFIAKVTDSGGNVATKTFTFKINPALVILTIASGSPLTSAQQYNDYFVYIESAAGTGPFTWGIGNGVSCANNTLPPGLIFNTGSTTDFSWISGTPTSSGTYCFTIGVRDSLGAVASKEFTLTVTPQPAVIRTTGATNIKICAGTTDVNCDNVGGNTYNSLLAGTGSGYPCSATYPTQCVMKSGIIDEFWEKARYGLQDFSKQAGVAIPTLSNCIEKCSSLPPSDPGYCATPDENFLTAVENAVPIDPTTTLVNGEYNAVNYYATDTTANCNPFRDATSCMKNFVLMISSGVGADNPPNPSGGAPNVYSDTLNCDDGIKFPNYKNLTKNSCYGTNNDLRPWPPPPADQEDDPYPLRQTVSTYIVNPMGTAATPNYDPDDPPVTTGDILKQAAVRGGGVYYEVTDASKLKAQLIQAFQDIIKRASAGTAASVLASGEGRGANLIQAVFYPRRKFEDTEIAWIGRLSNFWYYVDPFFGNSSIREDGDPATDQGAQADRILDLNTAVGNDYVTSMYYDPAKEATMAKRIPDTNGDGIPDPPALVPDVEFERLGTLWEAGTELWKRDLVASPRTIFTNLSGSLMKFSVANRVQLRPYMQAATDNEAEAIIKYIHGECDTCVVGGTTYSYRPRTVKADLNSDTDTLDTVGGIFEGTPRIWKLGDVLNSTPKIISNLPLNNYHVPKIYNDLLYKAFINTAGYQNRGMVFAGANDGMLHAFRLGKLEQLGGTQEAKLLPPSIPGGTLGEEAWAFVPKNVLPYLTYQKEDAYCHVYSVDLTPFAFDASVGTTGCAESNYWDCPKTGTADTWRTILIGGMRFGGACRGTATACPDVSGDGIKDCVNTPVDVAGESVGYSSYFALDVSDLEDPRLLWEWDGRVGAENHLGFSTTGFAVVKIKARNIDGAVSVDDRDKNGRWFAVIGSGPTGPISTTDQQFMGRSDQPARLFIIDIVNGPTAGNFWEVDTGKNNAFIGSMVGAAEDADRDYQDDDVYVPYVSKSALGGQWTDGGILRLHTYQDLNGINLSGSGGGNTALNPANWKVTPVFEGIGPMTSAVARLRYMGASEVWLFGGTGRYYYEKLGDTDDQAGQRHIFGFKDPCYAPPDFTFDPLCDALATTPTIAVSDLEDVSNIPDNQDITGFKGWIISLDAAGDYPYYENGALITRNYRAERVITDLLSSTTGIVYFTSYKPYNNECALGGKSFIWATWYNTGAAPGARLKGMGLMQVSTGSIEHLDFTNAFTDEGGRKSYALEGVPPTAQGLSVITTPQALKRMLHIRER